ncbi:MAG: DUF447 family protein [Nitrososphaerota archaeon]|nr:DUF447 family protein [Aigarchaeota archaeon]MDW8076753.1 DUF447 family protein [Nitrososphaerota archaeon]
MSEVYMEGNLKEFMDMNRIIPHVVYECILTTRADNETNAAPMGVVFENDAVLLRPFKNTKSYRLLTHSPYGVINFTDDVELFYITTFDTGSDFNELFAPSISVPVPSLIDAYAKLEFIIDGLVNEDENRAVFRCRVLKALWKRREARPYTRAEHAVIESLIHATRIKFFLECGMTQEAIRLAYFIKHYCALVYRIAPNTIYSSIMDKIKALISSWGLSTPLTNFFEFQKE